MSLHDNERVWLVVCSAAFDARQNHQRLMPASKKKGKGGGSGGKKKKKGAKATAEKDEIVKLCKSLLKCYQLHCTSKESIASPRVCQEIRNSIENEIALSKVNLTNCDCSFSLFLSSCISDSRNLVYLLNL